MSSCSPDLAAATRSAARGDQDAFRLLYRAVQPGLIRYLWAHSGGAAADLAAGTWLRVIDGLPRFAHGTDNFRGWVASIASDLRRQARRPAACAPVELLAADDGEDAVLEALSVANALDLITGLPATRAEAVLLTVVMGLDVRTAARVTGTLPGIVRVAARRGLRRLAGQLGQITRHPAASWPASPDDPLQHLLAVAAPEPCYRRELRGERAAVAAFLQAWSPLGSDPVLITGRAPDFVTPGEIPT